MKLLMKRSIRPEWHNFYISGGKVALRNGYPLPYTDLDMVLCVRAVRQWWDIPKRAEWNLILTKTFHPDAYKCKLKGDSIYVYDYTREKWHRYTLVYDSERTIARHFGRNIEFYARAEVYE